MKKHFYLLVFVLMVGFAQAQGPRMFLDVPAFYVHSAKIDSIANFSGIGMDIGFGLGTHHIMSKLSAGTTLIADFQSDEIEKTIAWGPFIRLEAGAGLWRSNGNKCSKHNASAFTVLPKAAVLYAFEPGEMQFTAGLELGFFSIRDYKRNTELFLDAGYNLTTENIYGNFGLRYFLNLRSY